VKALHVDSYSRKKPRRGFILLALGKGRTRLSGCGRADGGGTSAGGRGSTGLELLALLKRFARCAAFAAAVSLGLIAMPAWSREGDLDQRFGDHGRLSRMPGLFGPAWSLVTLDDGSTLLAGGGLINICPDEDPYCYDWGPVGYQARSFIAGISVSGSIDPDFDAFQSSKLQIRDFARQADGKLIVVGRRVSESSLDGPLVVRRINVDGSHDITFGRGGLFQLPRGGPFAHIATSVVVEPDDRIVVAGLMGSGFGLVVIRLLPDGRLDESFASSGVYYRVSFSGTYSHDEDRGPALLRTSDGGYRITDATCRVLALTHEGRRDRTFGDDGIATAHANAYCPAIAVQAHDELIVAGRVYDRPFITRLFANGAPDPNFSEDDIADALGGFGSVSALAISGNSIVVACESGPWIGPGEKNGAAIARLRATGALDRSFGDGGLTMIDLPSEVGSHTLVHDVSVLEDGSILAVGGDTWADRPFAVRLLGAQGGGSRGVLGVAIQGVLFVEENSREIVIEVRRTGGGLGRVTVGYRVRGYGGTRSATAGEDFVADSGRLEWNHLDRSSRQIRVRILDDAVHEDFEFVQVSLSDIREAGLGTRKAVIEIGAND